MKLDRCMYWLKSKRARKKKTMKQLSTIPSSDGIGKRRGQRMRGKAKGDEKKIQRVSEWVERRSHGQRRREECWRSATDYFTFFYRSWFFFPVIPSHSVAFPTFDSFWLCQLARRISRVLYTSSPCKSTSCATACENKSAKEEKGATLSASSSSSLQELREPATHARKKKQANKQKAQGKKKYDEVNRIATQISNASTL